MKALTPGGEMNVFQSAMYQDQQRQLTKQLGALGAGMGREIDPQSVQSMYAPAYQNLQRSEYDNYFNRLNPIMKTGYDATGRQAGIDQMQARLDTGQAGMEYQHGANLGNVELGKGEIKADYYNQQAGMWGEIGKDAMKATGQFG